jgi:hypothetical protein
MRGMRRLLLLLRRLTLRGLLLLLLRRLTFL